MDELTTNYYTWLKPGQKPGPRINSYIGRYLEYRNDFHYLVFPDEINVQSIDDVNFKRSRLATYREVAEAAEYERKNGFFGLHPEFLNEMNEKLKAEIVLYTKTLYE